MAEVLLKGRYRLLAETGRGTRTVTYMAEDTSLYRHVEVKILQEDYAAEQAIVDRFQEAARIMGSLSHPNIVDVYDIGTDKGVHYLVTEHVEGQTLESLLSSTAPLDVEGALEIAIQLCDGLSVAHRLGFVHGQLSPRNILLSEGRHTKVSDFRILDTPPPIPPGAKSPAPHEALYLSPEQVVGRRTTPASDVYALGVIIYEMLTGQAPFQGESYSMIAEKHLREEPKPLHAVNPDIPQPLSALVHTALSKASASRYRTAAALKGALLDYRRQSEQLEVDERIRLEERRRALEQVRLEQQTRTSGRRPAETRDDSSPVVHGPRADWLAIILGMIALLSVLGLIPLWLTVFLKYFA